MSTDEEIIAEEWSIKEPIFKEENKGEDYKFTVDWFSCNQEAWMDIIDRIKPQKILEIGSYEGRSTCFLIDTLSQMHESEIHCVDTWEGGTEHQGSDLSEIESRFFHNIKKALDDAKYKTTLNVHKGLSSDKLVGLLAGGMKGTFDFIYVDGSHEAPDVLLDAVLSYQLLRKGGVIAFNDYLWVTTGDLRMKDNLNHPKIAIDAFVNVFAGKTNVITWLPLYQLYVQKLVD